MIRVRFAPSPTGYLHVGGARTALFNWLYARRTGGVFVLRIEDTDVERSSDEMVEGILDGLRWLGLDWDEGPKIGGPHEPYFQSGRLETYRAMADGLVARGAAYYCYCTSEDLKAKREAAERAGGAWRYDRTCCALTPGEVADRERRAMPRAIRFKVPAATTSFDDLRHGATSVMEYARQGYLPEAMLNFLALLGWSPGDDRELFTRDELIAAFSLEGISGGNAVFNPEKLDWFDLQHIMRLAPDDLAQRLRPVLAEAGLWRDEYLTVRHAWFFNVLELLKPRVRTLAEFVTQGKFFFTDAVEYDPSAVDKHLRADGMRAQLLELDRAFAELATFDPQSLESALRGLAAARGVKAGSLIHAARVSATGKAVSPGLFETLSLIGPERVHARIAAAVELISAPRAPTHHQ